MYSSTLSMFDDTASVITLCLGRSPTTGKDVSPLVANQLRGVSVCGSIEGRGEGLQVTEMVGNVHILQVETHMPKSAFNKEFVAHGITQIKKIGLSLLCETEGVFENAFFKKKRAT